MADQVTFPDGSTVIASPPNRRRASELWQLDNKRRPEKIEDEDNDRDDDNNDSDNGEEIEQLKIELRQQRVEFERKCAERDLVERENLEDRMRAEERQRLECEREREGRAEVEAKLNELKKRMQHEAEVNSLKDRLMQEMERNRLLSEKPKGVRPDINDESEVQDGLKYSLPMNHADADVLTDFANCVPLKSRLKQFGLNETVQVNTVTSFFNSVNLKQPELSLILKDRNLNSSLRFSLNQYRNAFYAVKHPDDLTMLVCLLKAICKYCEGMDYKVKAALKKAGSLNHKQRLQEMNEMTATGTMKSMGADMAGLKFAELPGVREMLDTGDLDYIASFEEYILSVVCREKNILQKVMLAEEAWGCMQPLNDCDKLIDEESKLYGICKSWTGKDMCTDYHRFLHLISLAPSVVRAAYSDYVSSPHSVETENSIMFASWDKYVEIFKLVWSTAESKENISACISGEKHYAEPAAEVATDQSRMKNQRQYVRRPIGDINGSVSRSADIELACNKCGKQFYFTVSQQQYHTDQGWENQPNKCDDCRDKQRPCKLLAETGDCRFGSACRYSHGLEESKDAELEAWLLEREKKKKGDDVPEEGFEGLPRLSGKVRFQQ